jgi:hypothetical protein
MLRNCLIVAVAAIPGRAIQRLSGPACALALVLLLAGNVAARELPGDGQGCLAAGPCLDRSIKDLHVRHKLATKAGYDILVRG